MGIANIRNFFEILLNWKVKPKLKMWKHLFLPHSHTHKKAHLLSTKAFIAYMVIFLLLQYAMQLATIIKPGVLGVSTAIDYKEVIRLTNVEREKAGLSPLKENSLLDESAFEKGENMYQEDYWAHYSPSGKDPWSFMKSAGYSFSYAGENLARNFYTAQDVVNAWMASPTHRDNILNSNYTEIGISVNDGILQGQDTILVIQHFGRPVEYIAQAPAIAQPAATTKPVALTQKPPTRTPQPVASQTPVVTSAPAVTSAPIVSAQTPAPLAQANTDTNDQNTKGLGKVMVQGWSIDPYLISKNLGLTLIVFIGSLIAIDLYVMRRRMVHRFTSNHLSHFALLSLAANVLIHSGPGQIL